MWSRRGGRVVGGVAADPAPWMVQLLRGRKHICAGALVSPRHVLTAAHCVQQHRPDLRLRLAEGAEHAPQHVLVHEGFDASELRHDLALLVLERPAAMTRGEMVCLPEVNAEGHEDSTALVSGWGSTGPRDQTEQRETVAEDSPEHREAMVRTLKRDQCEEAYLGLLDITEEKLCAAGDGVDTCQEGWRGMPHLTRVHFGTGVSRAELCLADGQMLSVRLLAFGLGPHGNLGLPQHAASGSICAVHPHDHRSSPNCGVAARPTPVNESRIVGGTPTDIDQWPWQVSLHHRRPSSGAPGRRLCAASLVSASWLLTAAHCLLDPAAAEGTGRLLPSGLWLACRAGQCVRLRKLAVHAGFRRHNYTHDVALAELVQPLPLPARPICLPMSPSSGGSATVGRHCVITGWGARRPLVSRATKLQQASLPVLPWDLCRRAYPWAAALRRWLLCAGLWKGGRGPCHGDSGGPLQCQRSDGRWQLSGLVSWGAGCGRPGRPAVFVRVAAYRRWIRDATKRLQHQNQTTPRDKDSRQQGSPRNDTATRNFYFPALSLHAFVL